MAAAEEPEVWLAPLRRTRSVAPRRAAEVLDRLQWLAALWPEVLRIPAGPHLVWRAPAGDVRVTPVKAAVLFGRDPGCDIVCDDPRVSRRHAQVRPTAADGVWLDDLGARNGTRVNGVRVTTRRLRDGDVISAGDFRAAYLCGADE